MKDDVKWAGEGASFSHAGPELELPFKPFTLAEVKDVTGASGAEIDAWLPALPLRTGCGVTGLDDMGCFAVFVAHKWRHEGAPPGRPEGVMRFVAALPLKTLHAELNAGRSFPAVGLANCPSILVPPPRGTLGERLNLKVLYDEFRERLARVFQR